MLSTHVVLFNVISIHYAFFFKYKQKREEAPRGWIFFTHKIKIVHGPTLWWTSLKNDNNHTLLFSFHLFSLEQIFSVTKACILLSTNPSSLESVRYVSQLCCWTTACCLIMSWVWHNNLELSFDTTVCQLKQRVPQCHSHLTEAACSPTKSYHRHECIHKG